MHMNRRTRTRNYVYTQDTQTCTFTPKPLYKCVRSRVLNCAKIENAVWLHATYLLVIEKVTRNILQRAYKRKETGIY